MAVKYLVPVVLALFAAACIGHAVPQGMGVQELAERNRQLSIENLRLQAELSTYQEECR
jgi:hypothetical protein